MGRGGRQSIQQHIPVNIGEHFQTSVMLLPENWPSDSSRKNRGIPAKIIMITYGIKNAPVYNEHPGQVLLLHTRDINEHLQAYGESRTASIFIAQIGKSPEIPQSNSVWQTGHEEVAFTRPITSLLFQHFIISFNCLLIHIILKWDYKSNFETTNQRAHHLYSFARDSMSSRIYIFDQVKSLLYGKIFVDLHNFTPLSLC